MELEQKNLCTILLAEDNPINTHIISQFLARLGYHNVDVVGNGLEAIEAYNKKIYDLIFMDCQMPELDGYAATKKIRSIESENGQHHIPIIAMTAHTSRDDKEICLEAGMDDYLAKPVSVVVLDQIIEHWRLKKPLKKTNTKIGNHHLNTERLQLIFGTDKHLIRDFLHAFVDNTQKVLAELSEAIECFDEQVAKAKCHQLKGSCGNAGAECLYQLLVEQELAINDNDWSASAVLQNKLILELEYLKKSF